MIKVYDKTTGEEIKNVIVTDTKNESIGYCRMMADQYLDKADKMHEKEIIGRYNQMLEIFQSKKPDFEKIDRLREEIEHFRKDVNRLFELAGEWEDKEFKARLMPVLKIVSSWAPNPHHDLIFKQQLMSDHLRESGLPNLANQLAL